MTGSLDRSVLGSTFKYAVCIQHGLWKYGLRMTYQPGVFPMPMISTYFFASMLLINVYVSAGPVQQPVNSVTRGRLGGSLLVGLGRGVSVKLGVGVMVGGKGVAV